MFRYIHNSDKFYETEGEYIRYRYIQLLVGRKAIWLSRCGIVILHPTQFYVVVINNFMFVC
jgi:hypothetical protein